MKNLKKLREDQLKGISGAGVHPIEPEFCMYYCNGTVICAACDTEFKCPDSSNNDM